MLANSSLRSLQYAISDVIGWKSMHLYVFAIGEQRFGDPEYDYEFDGWLDDSKMTIGRVSRKFAEFEFIYDFGDEWCHRVTIEDVFPADLDEKYPVCVAGENSGPPEDCGGVAGFEAFKQSAKIIKRRKPRGMIEMLRNLDQSKGFDPTFFDLNSVNKLRLHRRRCIRKISKSELT